MRFRGFLFLLLCAFLFFWQLKSIPSITNSKRSIFLQDTDENFVYKKHGISKSESQNEMVKNICAALFTDSPSQKLFNRWLKKIYIYSLKKPLSADLLNLQGRLFWYKVYLNNKEHIYSNFWTTRWQNCAMQSWNIAKQKYRNSSSKFCLYIQEWMPEKQIFTMEEYKKYICNESAKDITFLQHRAFDIY